MSCVSVDDKLKSLGFRWAIVAAAAAPCAALHAQSLDGTPVPCKGQIISRIEVSARPPFEVKGSGLQKRLARQLTAVHATTNPDIISRFLALRPGMACSELRRLESERILRSQPYLADASVIAYPDNLGGVYLSVTTVDEVSLVLGGGGSGAEPYIRSFRLGEENLMGEATSLIARWSYSENFRDNFSAEVIDYQFLGRPYQLKIDGARNELGGNWGFELSHPFLTDLQRISWRTTAGSREDYRYFRREDDLSRPAVLLQRVYGDIGGVVRVGPPGKLALIGASVSYEDEMPEPFGTKIGFGTTQRDTVTELEERYIRRRVTRVNALAGYRNVRYMRVTGLETLDGAQDIRRGFEIATVLGRGMGLFGGNNPDLFASANAYVGVGGPASFGTLESTIEGRHDDGQAGWDGILGSARLATYFKPAPRHTLHSSLELTGGWEQRIPFQLTFADRDGGPRGYRDSWLAGGRRLVLRLEDRYFIGHLKQFASIGVAPFMDVGKLWAGDVPFGVDSRLNASVGVSILASVPPRSQRMWRFDIMYPLNRDSGAKFKVRLFSRDYTSIFWKEPGDVNRNRERSIPTSVFNWP
jgi:hypothetical protein